MLVSGRVVFQHSKANHIEFGSPPRNFVKERVGQCIFVGKWPLHKHIFVYIYIYFLFMFCISISIPIILIGVNLDKYFNLKPQIPENVGILSK